MDKQFEIYDNFLDKKVFDNIKDIILDETFPWFFIPYVNTSEETEGHENFQFIHLFFRHNMRISGFYNILHPLFEKMKIQSMIKCKANLNIKSDENKIYGMHNDLMGYPFKSKTAIFYLNQNNGYTLLEDGTQIYPEENRLVVFDNDILHSGSSCTDKKARYVININYL